jgi:diguanylate cyclase (GGDEF)-like protein
MVRKTRQTERSSWVILLTDDDADYLEVTRRLIEREGHEVIAARSGEEALAVLAARRVDLLLLDFYMDGMTGEQVVEEIRKTDTLLQIVLQTGYASEQPPRQLLKRLDIQGYHDKSEGPDKLLMWVDVGLKAAFSSQLVDKSRQGLRYILDVTPELHRLQPLQALLQGIICQVTGLFGVADSFLASRAGAPQPDGFLAIVEDETELVVHAGTGRFAGSAAVKAGALDDAISLDLGQAMDTRLTQVNGQATAVPLCVGPTGIGVIYLDKAIRGEQDLELLAVFANQAAVAVRNAQLFDMATVDPLTGLYLRRFTEQWIIGELRKAYRHRHSLAMLVLDMDGLKGINDRAGHLAGDEALAAIGRVLRATLRESDVAGRFGGDEFVVLLPDTGLEGARRAAERLLALLECTSVHACGVEFPVRGSIGLAVLDGAAQPDHSAGPVSRAYFSNVYKTLLEQADAALYDAKRAGRAQACSASLLGWPSGGIPA